MPARQFPSRLCANAKKRFLHPCVTIPEAMAVLIVASHGAVHNVPETVQLPVMAPVDAPESAQKPCTLKTICVVPLLNDEFELISQRSDAQVRQVQQLLADELAKVQFVASLTRSSVADAVRAKLPQ